MEGMKEIEGWQKIGWIEGRRERMSKKVSKHRKYRKVLISQSNNLFINPSNHPLKIDLTITSLGRFVGDMSRPVLARACSFHTQPHTWHLRARTKLKVQSSLLVICFTSKSPNNSVLCFLMWMLLSELLRMDIQTDGRAAQAQMNVRRTDKVIFRGSYT